MGIIDKLTPLNIFEYNDYFLKYCALIDENIDRKKEKMKTEKHHIIPVCYYEHLGIVNARKNKEVNHNNIVNLLYKDHILAHYYLSLCAKEDWFKESNIHAFLSMTFYNKLTPEELTEYKILDKYQELYEKWIIKMSKLRSGLPMSDETKDKIRQKLKGVKKGPITEEHRKKLSEAAKHRKNGKNSTKGKISIYNKELNKKKYIEKAELDTYLSNGWVKGGIPHTLESKLAIGNNTKKCLLGKTRSEESKRKTSETLKLRWRESNNGWRNRKKK